MKGITAGISVLSLIFIASGFLRGFFTFVFIATLIFWGIGLYAKLGSNIRKSKIRESK